MKKLILIVSLSCFSVLSLNASTVAVFECKLLDGKNLDDVKEYLVKDLYNYTVPEIVITGANHFSLDLEHLNYKVGTLNISHAKKVMEYLKKVWGTSIDLKTIDNKGKPGPGNYFPEKLVKHYNE